MTRRQYIKKLRARNRVFDIVKHIPGISNIAWRRVTSLVKNYGWVNSARKTQS